MLPTIIGVSLATTMVADATVVMAHAHRHASNPSAIEARFVAATTGYTPAVAPFQKQIVPQILIAAPQTLAADVVAKVEKAQGVKNVEVVDAARALVAGKRVGVLGVEPSTFRAYTPQPSAQSDALWRNITAGDIAISFTMGQDGGIPLGSWTKIGGQSRQTPIRIGAYATMGIGQVDAVVSHATARTIGMPTGNALLVSAPHADLTKLQKVLTKVLPKNAKSAVLQSRIDGTTPPTGRPGSQSSSGDVMSAAQVTAVIRAAQGQLGVPYVWGGETPGKAFDCSGLVQYAFAQAGIKMPRTADIQAFTGWRIPYSQAEPGDLLTWKNDPTFNGVSHIAIYVGNNTMIVARHTGTLVQYQVPYMQNFWGAIRVDPQLAAQKAG